jgi:hydroxymethylpyrimidine/phosphomethylpyrimidine kinase
MSERIPRVLSIAGSDSGGGAGIQADLKAFGACGVHGTTAVTAITAQNTVGVSAVHAIPPEVIIAQVRAVVEDIGVDAVKIGMLGTTATVEAVSEALNLLAAGTPVVLDPVMVSESGAELLEAAARGALVALVLPRATVLTPNLPEARALLGRGPSSDSLEVAVLARELRALGPSTVVITGGHRERAVDLYYDGSQLVEIEGPRFPAAAAHGSGCTHSSVLAARIAWGDSPLQAARVAKRVASEAVRDGLEDVGLGPGPVDVLGVRAGRGACQDPGAACQDPGAARQDPRAACQDPGAARQDPRAACQDPGAARQDPRAACQDPRAACQDPRAACQDPLPRVT